MATYKGPVVFVHPPENLGSGDQGVHYPVGEDGHADLSRPLFWDAEKETYRDKADSDPAHFEAYHENHLELQFPDNSQIEVTESEAAAIREKLAELRGEA